MAGLKGLAKGERLTQELDAASFIGGAQNRVKSLSGLSSIKTGRSFSRYTFSLTSDVSEQIDRLSLIPREFRATRSDVIKAAIQLLAHLTDAEITKALESIQ